MSLHKDQAIILSTRAFGESDKIIRFFTLSSGKLSGIAKGARKSQKRFMNTLEQFNRVHVEYFEKPAAGLVRIENADIEEHNAGIETSLKRVCIASYFSEFVDRLTREKERNEPLFHALETVLNRIKHVEFTASDILYYELLMLGHLGYMPNFRSCVVCGTEMPEDDNVCYSRERGGTLCLHCARGVPHRRYPQGLFTQLACFDRAQTGLNRAFDQLGRQVLEDFISFHLSVEFKSLRILKSVTG